MLIKESDHVGTGLVPTVFKSINGNDVSRMSSFGYGQTVDITVKIPRKLGVCGVVMRVLGENESDIAFDFADTDCVTDTYKYALDTKSVCRDGEHSAFLYYEYLFLRGFDTMFSSSINNIDFKMTEKSSQKFSLLVYDENYSVPDWLGDNIIYHIFVDRFYKGDGETHIKEYQTENNDWYDGIPEYAEVPGGKVKNSMHFGGNLWGVAEKLSYLKKLGVGTVYLSPIFDAASNHKYDTGDYTIIDPAFGGESAFDRLIKKADELGIHIILDGVFNHTGDDSRYFNKYGHYDSVGAYTSQRSEYYPWYDFKDYPDKYECWWNIPILPRLNHECTDCRRYFTGSDGIAVKYIKKGISGWRLDVADELNDDFLDEFRVAVKNENKDGIIIGEVWENAAEKKSYGKQRRYLRGKQLDSVMNYPLRNGIIKFVLYRDGNFLYDVLTEIYSIYPRTVSDSLMNLLGTHDTERILTVLSGDETDTMTNKELSVYKMDCRSREKAIKRLKVASVIQYTVYGTPSVFYGDEAGTEGGRDPFCRKPYPWGREDSELISHYEKLGKIRTENGVYDHGDFNILSHGDGYIVFERSKNGEKLITAANTSDKAKIFHLPYGTTELFSGKECKCQVVLEGMSAGIYKMEKNDVKKSICFLDKE